MPGPLLAVDAPFLLYRSHFAMPESVVGVDDRPIGALLGATNVILRIAAERAPRAIVFCFGAEAAHYRVELFAPYHADRPPVPPPLAWQFEVAPDYFEQFGWTVTTTLDLEADDLLHSFAAAETEAGGHTLLLTGDRDMYQCANDTVHVLRLTPGGPPAGAEIDPDQVQEMYGIPPKLVPDFIALRGDPSDGLPGASGIGPKIAAALLQRHGSLEAAIANAELERPRIAAALRDQAPQLLEFREIATLRDAPVPRPLDRNTDLEGGARAARSYGMRRLAERLEQAQGVEDL